jgi:hypothetical protein
MSVKLTSTGGIGPTFRTLGRTFLEICALAVWLLCVASSSVSAQDGSPSVLEPKIDAAAERVKDDPLLQSLSDARRRGTIHFVIGNLLFVLLHEMGHVAITEMGLPVLGREEDAADAFAAVSMIWMKNAFSDRVLAEAAKGWFYSDQRDRMRNVPVAFYDEHSLDRQRAYQIVCYMVGSDRENLRISLTRPDFQNIAKLLAKPTSAMPSGRGVRR